MRTHPTLALLLAWLPSLSLVEPARANASAAFSGGRAPGSLLLFAEFDNRTGTRTLLTVTNTNCDYTPLPGPNLYVGTIDIEFVYVGRFDAGGNTVPCTEFNRTARLSPCDTLTVITAIHNPQLEQGFVYVFAKSPITGEAVSFDYLIGSSLAIDGISLVQFGSNAVSFQSPVPQGTITDLDDDDTRDLDGVEYSQAPDQILVPRFLGADDAFASELILIGLSGGATFTTVVDFTVYNDNEEVFSTQHTFACWTRVRLIDISGVFANLFLKSTNHAAGEILGSPKMEAGWFRVDGAVAWSLVEHVDDPAIYAVLVENVALKNTCELPFELGQQWNGDLFPYGIFGDGDIGDNQ